MVDSCRPPRLDPALLQRAQEAAAPDIARLQRTPRLPLSQALEYDPQRRLEAWVGAIQHLRAQQPEDGSLSRIVFDGSHQGSGKSHAVPELQFELAYARHPAGDERDTRNVIYVSASYRSPSIPEIEQSFVEVPSRHQGIVHAPTADGTVIRRQITQQELKDGVRPQEEATCTHAHRLQTLVGRGFGYAESVAAFCKEKCPYRPKDGDGGGGDGSCPHRQATKGFYAKPEKGSGRVEPIIHARTLRVGMQGLEGLMSVCPTYVRESVVVIDETPQLFDAAIRSNSLSTTRLSQLLAYVPVLFPQETDALVLGVFPELTEETAKAAALTEQLLTLLLQLLAGVEDPHGLDHHAIRRHLAPWIEDVIATYGHGDDIKLPFPWRLGARAHTVEGYQFEQAITAADTEAIDNLPTPLLPDLIHCVLGLDAGEAYGGHSLSITRVRSGAAATKANYRLTLTRPSGLPIRIGQMADAVVVGDATADPEQIRALFSTPEHPAAFTHLRATPVAKADQADVLFFQVQDLGALPSRERRDHQKQRLQALRDGIPSWAAALLQRDPATIRCGFIEHKACAQPGDGKWHTGTARGGNQFQGHDVIGLIGTPIKNLSASLSEYVALSGDATASLGGRPEDNSPGFIRYQAQLVAAELQQAWERLRTIRRPGERLIVLFISNADLSGLPIDVIQLDAADIAPAAARKTEKKLQAVVAAIHQLAEQGTPLHRISTRDVSRLAGVGETTVRRVSRHQSEGLPWALFVASCLESTANPQP